MAWPVNAVDMIATVMMAGTITSARSPTVAPSPVSTGSRDSPISTVIGMNMVSSSCSPPRSSSLSSSRDWAARIVVIGAGRGAGEKAPAEICWRPVSDPMHECSSPQILPGQSEENVFEAPAFDAQIGDQHVDPRAPRGDRGQHLRVIGPTTR